MHRTYPTTGRKPKGHDGEKILIADDSKRKLRRRRGGRRKGGRGIERKIPELGSVAPNT